MVPLLYLFILFYLFHIYKNPVPPLSKQRIIHINIQPYLLFHLKPILKLKHSYPTDLKFLLIKLLSPHLKFQFNLLKPFFFNIILNSGIKFLIVVLFKVHIGALKRHMLYTKLIRKYPY